MTRLEILVLIKVSQVLENPSNETYDLVSPILLKYYTMLNEEKEGLKRIYPDYRMLFDSLEPHEGEFLCLYFAIEQLKYSRVFN